MLILLIIIITIVVRRMKKKSETEWYITLISLFKDACPQNKVYFSLFHEFIKTIALRRFIEMKHIIEKNF